MEIEVKHVNLHPISSIVLIHCLKGKVNVEMTNECAFIQIMSLL